MNEKSKKFRLALVTGASSGIGKALALLLAKEGIDLILAGRNLKRLQVVAHEAEKLVAVTVAAADLARYRERKELIKIIREKTPDLIINNAGFGLYGPALTYSASAQLEMVEVNNMALLDVTLEAARALVGSGKEGVVMNISSAASFVPVFPYFSVYAACKVFVTHLSQSLDYELKSKGVRILAACPGMVASAFRERASGGFFKETQKKDMSVDYAAQQIWRQILKRKPIHIFNWKTRFSALFSRLLPKPFLSWLLKRQLAKRLPPKKAKDTKAIGIPTPPILEVEKVESEFAQFGLDPAIIKALTQMGFKSPSPIQQQAIPLILQGKDLIALAETGSGKTAACAMPICNRIDISRPVIQALIVVPTRELALQYATETQKIGKEKRVKVFALFGGEDYQLQEAKLEHGVHVLIATPGRLIDFVYRRRINLSHVETLILDEADEMLSMGFYADLEFIIQCLVHDHQTLLFSATMPHQIQKLAKHHMKEPQEVVLNKSQASPKSIRHSFFFCQNRDRDQSLIQLLNKLQPPKAMIFCRSRIETERVAKVLKSKFSGVEYLHGGLSQSSREMLDRRFRTGKIQLLVTTDVAARGIDIADLTHVFIYHLSNDPNIYIHRSGRTGRREKSGAVVTLVTSRDLGIVQEIMDILKQEPEWLGKAPTLPSRPLKQ